MHTWNHLDAQLWWWALNELERKSTAETKTNSSWRLYIWLLVFPVSLDQFFLIILSALQEKKKYKKLNYHKWQLTIKIFITEGWCFIPFLYLSSFDCFFIDVLGGWTQTVWRYSRSHVGETVQLKWSFAQTQVWQQRHAPVGRMTWTTITQIQQLTSAMTFTQSGGFICSNSAGWGQKSSQIKFFILIWQVGGEASYSQEEEHFSLTPGWRRCYSPSHPHMDVMHDFATETTNKGPEETRNLHLLDVWNDEIVNYPKDASVSCISLFFKYHWWVIHINKLEYHKKCAAWGTSRVYSLWSTAILSFVALFGALVSWH